MPSFEAKTVTWHDLEVGQHIGTIHCFVTPEDIAMAADLFSDDYPVHFSKDFAKASEWEGIVGPFYLLDSIARWVGFMHAGGIRCKNYTINAHGVVESYLPIRPGDILEGKMWVEDKYVKREKNFLTWRIELRNQQGELVTRKFWTSLWTDREIIFPTPETYK
jgi:acyl dehydratase